MVFNNTKDSFVVVASLLWSEVYYNSSRRVCFNSADCLTKAEQIVLVSV